jgi:hypothetical protein
MTQPVKRNDQDSAKAVVTPQSPRPFGGTSRDDMKRDTYQAPPRPIPASNLLLPPRANLLSR